jgi:hypothetical protein
MSDTVTFKAQLSPLQSAMQHGPDGMLIKLVPIAIDEALAAELFQLQQCALRLTIKDVMGDFTVDASIPDTASALRINKTSPQVMFHIPRGDVLTGLRLVALFQVVFSVEITGGPTKPKRERKAKPGTDDNGKYWQAMHHLDWWYAPGLCEVLGCEKTEAEAAQALKVALNVSSRREISPDDFEAWCEQNSIASPVTISQQARAKA